MRLGPDDRIVFIKPEKQIKNMAGGIEQSTSHMADHCFKGTEPTISDDFDHRAITGMPSAVGSHSVN